MCASFYYLSCNICSKKDIFKKSLFYVVEIWLQSASSELRSCNFEKMFTQHHMLHVTCFKLILGGSRGRVCYQRGLDCLLFFFFILGLILLLLESLNSTNHFIYSMMLIANSLDISHGRITWRKKKKSLNSHFLGVPQWFGNNNKTKVCVPVIWHVSMSVLSVLSLKNCLKVTHSQDFFDAGQKK